jgi:Na+/H+ antiporter NhaC
MTLLRGMSLSDLMQGLQKGLRGVVYGSVILLMAVVVGGISRDAGAGVFLVEILGDAIPPVVLPLSLVILTMIISFSTGTSWGTFAVSLPIAMPLAWAVAQAGSVDNPVFFLSICFAAVINGSIFGDQCSPISDTTVLSCVSTGCDLMDHVRTQIVPCSIAMAISILLWTLLAALA